MQKNKLNYIFLILIVFIVGGCSKQEAPDVSPEAAWEIRDQERLKACSNVNFTKNLLSHRNTFFLFKCTGWDKQFPSLNAGIQKINPNSWNHFFKPIDDAFLNDIPRRDRIFSHIRKLDSQRGLDDLSRVITALNETNFYDGLRDMFLCSENPSHRRCEGRKGKELSRVQIKDLLKLVELKPVAIKSLSVLIRELMKALDPDSDILRDDIRKFFYNDDFVDVRLNLITSAAQKFYQGLSPLESEFFKKLLITKWKGSENPYLYEWVQNPNFTNAVYRRLTKYPVVENPEALKDLKLVKRGYHYPLYCKPYSQNGQIDIDLKTHVDEFLDFVYKNNYEEFHNYVIQNIASLQLALTFCPKLKNYTGKIAYVENGEVRRAEHSLNFVDIEKDLVELMSEIPLFDLSKFITFLASRNLGDIPPNPGFILDLATEEMTEWIVEMVKVIYKAAPDYFDHTFPMMKNFTPSFYNSSGLLLNEFLAKENESKIKALSKSWMFLNREEQNFLFNFIDRHLKEDTNYRLLFRFYATMLEEYATVSEVFAEGWTETEEKLENSYVALYDIVNNFSGKNVLKDFDKFFSRDHIINIMKVVTRGPETRAVALNRLSSTLITDYINKIPGVPYKTEFTPGDTDYSRRAKQCIDSISELESLYVLLNNFPKDCKYFESKEISLQTFSWLAQAQGRYEKMFDLPSRVTGTLLDSDGILNPDSLNNSIALLRIIDEILAFRVSEKGAPSGGIKYLLDIGQVHLLGTRDSDSGFLSLFSSALRTVADYLNSGGREHRYLRNKKVAEVIVDKGPSVKTFMNWFSTLLSDYSSSLTNGSLEPEQYVEDLRFSCSNYMNHDVGGLPCPSKERVKLSFRSIFKDLTILNEDAEATAIGVFLEALIPGFGLAIPYRSETTKLKRITLKESAEMVYKLTDKKYPANNKKIKFNENDAYDALYDVDNWSGLKWRKIKKELAEIDEEEERLNPEDELFFKDPLVSVNTLDRVEITVRDVRFDMNYLGGHYKNAVAKAVDYNETVSKKLSMFKTCTKLRFCGKFFNREQIRMGRNAVEAYPGLLDANTVEEFSYGEYMQVLLGGFVRSSSKKSQKSALVKIKIFGKRIEVPWVQTKKQLRQHNGKILTKISMLSGFSNLSRFVRDRMGRTEEEFQKNINSKRLKILNNILLSGLDPQKDEKLVATLLLNLRGEEGNSVFNEFVDWVSTASYQELREFEALILDGLTVTAFLGNDISREGYQISDKDFSRYQNNSIKPLLDFSAKILPSLMKFKNNWPMDFNFIDLVRTVAKPVKFLSTRLLKEESLSKSVSYKLLNEGMILFNKFFYEATENTKSGAYYLANYIKNESDPKEILEIVKGAKEYSDYLENSNDDGDSGYQVLSDNLSMVLSDVRFDLTHLMTYLFKTTKVNICQTEVDCRRNVHYDEPTNLVIFGSRKSGSQQTNAERLIYTLFEDNINDYTQMIDQLVPLIRVQAIR